jgi:hypothetical protein
MDKFELNLLKTVVAELYFSLGMQAAREMYGKSYFSLGCRRESRAGSNGAKFCECKFPSVKARFANVPNCPKASWLSKSRAKYTGAAKFWDIETSL